MIDYFKLALSKYAEFTGRSRRSEYWYFQLVCFLIGIAISILAFVVGDSIANGLGGLINLALLIPGIAVAVRRLHDTGRSGWWLLISLTGIGIFVLLYWLASDSDSGVNEYGANPKQEGNFAGDIGQHLVD